MTMLSRFMPSFGDKPIGVRPSQASAPSSSAQSGIQRKTLGGKGVNLGGGKEKFGLGGVGLGKGGLKRHR